jgi:glutamyl-tRNA synthetase
MIVRTRFAPSPTGNLHLGNIRTALYCWLYARNRGGEFVLRIEDTDQERSTAEATQFILDSMTWLGLNYDAGPFYQAKRLERYCRLAENLIKDGLAYRCYCSKERLAELREKQFSNKEKPRYDGHCRDKDLPADSKQPFVIRFKNPTSGTVNFDDQILGPLSFQNTELDDLVLIRTAGFPTYNFSVVIDDLDMKITHVIRGADHVNNTPRQINIFHAFGAQPPIFTHVPMILGSDGTKLSKRHGALSVLQYRDDGFLPEAVLNCLVRLGWSHGDQEIFSRDEMIKLFDIKDINKAAAAFNPEKLLWLNRFYIKTMDPKTIVPHLVRQLQELKINYSDGPALEDIVIALRERVETLREMAVKSRFFYENISTYQEDAQKNLNHETIPILQAVYNRLSILPNWTDESLHQTIEDIAKQLDIKLGKVAQPIRASVTGTTVSPPINITLKLLGKRKALERINNAINYINNFR